MIIAMGNENEWPDTEKNVERAIHQAIQGLVSFPMAESDELIDMERNLMRVKRIISLMGSQINDLLEYTKLEKGLIKAKKQSFSKRDLYKQIEFLLQPMCEDKKLTYEMNFDRLEDVSVKTDKGMLLQMLWQLLDNAVQYSDEGKHITMEAYTLEKTKKEIINCFVIKDQGIGMSRKFQECLFQPFMREDNRMSHIVDGTGLGLYIVRQIVKLMHGEIQVETEENKGTSIAVRLPFPICHESGREETSKQENLSILKGKRVILCEENTEHKRQTRRCLENAGMLVEEAENGQEVIEWFQKNPPYYYDMILTNIKMSGMNGFEITKGIRQLGRKDAYLIPIIALITDAYEECSVTPIAGGMDAEVEAPVDVSKLAVSLREFWKKYRNKRK